MRSTVLVDHDVLPFTSVFIEPAKVLFLNNAINHGVLTPLGIQQAQETGKSVLFLLEANPAAGFGLLMAYTVFGKGMAKATAPGAAIIQFFGGIHEVYFPYVLMKPAADPGHDRRWHDPDLHQRARSTRGCAPRRRRGRSSRSTRRPPPGSFLGVTLSVIGGFAVDVRDRRTPAAHGQGRPRGGGDLQVAMGVMVAMKGKESAAAAAGHRRPGRRTERPDPLDRVRLRRGDGFVGDGRLGAPQEDPGRRVLRRHRREQGDLQPRRHLRPGGHPPGPRRPGRSRAHPVGGPRVRGQLHGQPEVRRDRRAPAPDQRARSRRGRGRTGPRRSPPGWALSSPRARSSSTGRPGRGTTPSPRPASCSSPAARSTPAYVASMHEREKSVSTFVGNSLAIPHGTNDAKAVDPRQRALVRPLPPGHRLERQGRRSSSSASPEPATTTSPCWARSPRCSSTPTKSRRSRPRRRTLTWPRCSMA